MKQNYLKSFCARCLTLLVLALLSTNYAWGETKTLTFDLTSNPGSWPTSNPTTLTDYTYTLDNVGYTFGLKNVKCNSGYLMLTATAVLGLPAIEGYKLTKVVAKNSSNCSTSTNVGVSSSSSSGSYISGGAIQTWSTTSSSYTYNLSGTSNNTVYYLYVTNKNAQITELALTYEGGTTPTRTLQSIYIDGTADKLEYIEGESFDVAGLKVMGKYDTGDDTEITSGITWSFEPEVFAIGDETVSVTAKVGDFTSNPLTVNVTVNEKPAAKYVSVAWNEIVDGGKYFITATNEEEYYFAAKVFAAKNATAIAFDAALAPEADMWTFTKNGDTWKISTADAGLYMTNDNNGLVCAANKGADFTIAQGSSAEFTDLTASDGANTRYIALYNKQDFRCYKTSGTSGIRDLKLYCKGATVTIASSGYSSFSSTYAVTIPEGITAYYATGVEGNKVSMIEVEGGVIPANEGVIIKGVASQKYTFIETVSDKSFEGNCLVAVSERIEGLAPEVTIDNVVYKNYVFTGGQFHPFTSGATVSVGAGKAYLQIVKPSDENAKFEMSFGDVTGIKSLTPALSEGKGVYNLNGMKVNEAYKGIVIMNGKKYINK